MRTLKLNKLINFLKAIELVSDELGLQMALQSTARSWEAAGASAAGGSSAGASPAGAPPQGAAGYTRASVAAMLCPPVGEARPDCAK